jgi:hypothetical protein|tara:strand:- start:1279 stop:1638 length:360 start_codon:yes stop_codon:yes gene_type:complete
MSDSKIGPWITITLDDNDQTTAEVDLGAEFQHVQVENPTIISGAITVQVARATGGTFLQVYRHKSNATGDVAHSATARTGAGMNFFRDICGQFIKINTGASQTAGPLTLYARGVGKLGP